jgi:hypothetical protein
VGGGAWHYDRHSGELVSGILAAETYDGSYGVRRRSKPRSHPHAWQGRRSRQRTGACGLGLSTPSRRPSFFSRSARRCGGSGGVRRSISDWLCFMHLCHAGPTAELDRYIGAVGSLMRQVTTSWTTTSLFRRRSGTRPVLYLRVCKPSDRESSLALEKTWYSRDRNDPGACAR